MRAVVQRVTSAKLSVGGQLISEIEKGFVVYFGVAEGDGKDKADFIAKLQISLKECYETEYWIEIAQKANIISEDLAKSVLHDCGSIRRMLIASINTAKSTNP